jgi:hypothetical protein
MARDKKKLFFMARGKESLTTTVLELEINLKIFGDTFYLFY